MRSLRAQILLVGDEILDGYVADDNLRPLAECLRAHGIALERVSVLPDDVAVIAAELEQTLAAPRPALVITTGGTGGTWDDVTYEAVSVALGVPLHVDPQLETSVHRLLDWAAAAGREADEDAVAAMMRIATVPEGSIVHFLGGWLVCVQLDLAGGLRTDTGCTLLILPGPPGHVRQLVDELIAPSILGAGDRAIAVAEVQHDYPETLVVGELGRIDGRLTLKMGSYPGDPMLVRFRGAPKEVAAAAAEFRAYLEVLDSQPSAARVRAAWSTARTTWTTE